MTFISTSLHYKGLCRAPYKRPTTNNLLNLASKLNNKQNQISLPKILATYLGHAPKLGAKELIHNTTHRHCWLGLQLGLAVGLDILLRASVVVDA
jgi:hypothetical protein